jgi:DNA-binding LacI/PurR family transcriptional regulator
MSTGLGKRAERVYCFLRQRIDTGDLLPGRRLPTQHELSSSLGVSRSTVQTALQQLIDEGRVRSRRGSGMFVLEHHPGDAEQPAANLIAVMCEVGDTEGFSLQADLLRREHLVCFHFQQEANWDLADERTFLQQLLKVQPKALIACCSPNKPTNVDCLQDLSRAGCRIIHTGPYTRELPQDEYLMPDYRAAGYLAGEALAASGYDCFLFAMAPTDSPRAWLMEDGFAAALRKAGHDYQHSRDQASMTVGTASSSAVAQQLFSALDVGKTVGVFACADWMVHIISQELCRRDATVPEQVGVIACGNQGQPVLVEGRSFDSIGFDLQAIMARAVEAVVAEDSPVVRELVPPTYVSRNTIR